MDFINKIICWFREKEEKNVKVKKIKIEDVNFDELGDDIMCSHCFIGINNKDLKHKPMALMDDIIFNFCDHKCYKGWLNDGQMRKIFGKKLSRNLP